MRYYIDGYNLLFSISFSSKPLQEEREAIISKLQQLLTSLKISATLIFDSAHTPGDETHTQIGQLDIIFTRSQQTADQWIEAALQEMSSCSQITVVTSDRLLAWSARQKGAKTIDSKAFLEQLQTRHKNHLFRKKHPKPPKQSPSLPTPAPQTPPQDMLSRYLAIFEERLQALPQPTQKKNPKTKQRPEESDNARWLRLFSETSDY